MSGQGGAGNGSPPQPADALRAGFASFDTAGFLEAQQRERDQRAADLLAAADALCPSSSEEESLSSEGPAEAREEEREEGEVDAASKKRRRRRRSRSRSPSRDRKRHRKERKHKKEKHKKRNKEREARNAAAAATAEFDRQVAAELAVGVAARRSSVPAWVGLGAAVPASRAAGSTLHLATDTSAPEGCYSDARADPGNVAFGAPYRDDVPRYRRWDPSGSIAAALRGGTPGRGPPLHPTAPPPPQEKRKGAKARIWRRLAWSQPGHAVEIHVPPSGYLPLDPLKDQQQPSGMPDASTAPAAALSGYTTPEEYLLAHNREFNAAIRERPGDLQLWLDFAAFQDEAVALVGGGRPRRGAARAAAEKQAAILERALEHHPGSDRLLLALLRVADRVCEDEEAERRWRRALAARRGSLPLWRAFLARKKAQFAGFQASEMGAVYCQALAALRQEQVRLAGAGAPPEELVELERGLAELALAAAEFRLQTGHTELGVIAIRALLELNYCAPEGWPAEALEAMFEEFWRAGGRLIGDADARGWGVWLAAHAEGPPEEEEDAGGGGGGWVDVEPVPQDDSRSPEAPGPAAAAAASASPWEDLAPAILARFGHALRWEGDSGAAEAQESLENAEMGEKEDEEEVPQGDAGELNEEELMARLGVDLDAALAEAETEVTPAVLSTWIDLERERDAHQWEPRAAGDVNGQQEGEEEESTLRVLTWDDVAPHLVLLSDPVARETLLFGCLRLLGAPLPPGASPPSLEETADEIGAVVAWLGAEGVSLGRVDPFAGSSESLEWLNGTTGWTAGGMRELPWWAAGDDRRNCLLRCLKLLLEGPERHNPAVAAAAMDLAAWRVATSEGSGAGRLPVRDWAAGREFAKVFLAQYPDYMVVWAAFAGLESASGRTKAAHKAYTACLARALAPSDAAAPGLAQLALGCARAKLQLGAAPSAPSAAAAAANQLNTAPLSLGILLGASPQTVHAAARPLLWLGSQGAVLLSLSTAPTPDEVTAARRGFQTTLLRLMRAGPDKLTLKDAYAVSAAAAMEVLVSGGASPGVAAALAIYDQVLGAVGRSRDSSSYTTDTEVFVAPACAAAVRLLEIERCAMAVDAAAHAVPAVPPSRARDFLLDALNRYPGSPPLLRLLRALAMGSHAVGALRRQLNEILAGPLAPAPVWVMLIGVEAGVQAPRTAVRAALERAVGSAAGRRCPALWRAFLRFERAAGTPEALHRVFLRAVEACPWAKGLWMDGLALLCGRCPPRQAAEFLAVMKDKDLAVRTDVLEAVLARME